MDLSQIDTHIRLTVYNSSRRVFFHSLSDMHYVLTFALFTDTSMNTINYQYMNYLYNLITGLSIVSVAVTISPNTADAINTSNLITITECQDNNAVSKTDKDDKLKQSLAEEKDSLVVGGELEEVIVQGRTQRVIKHGVEYTPDKQMKRSSQNAAGLLLNMQIPTLQVTPRTLEVTTFTGKSVSMFINYIAATSEELNGLNTDDVIRVEVLDYPSDPRFQGAQHVVNFIVHKYEWGGYTKINLTGQTPSYDYTSGNVYSKFAYKRMTFDLNGGATLGHSTTYGTDRETSFRNIMFNGMHYDEVIKRSVSQDYLMQKNTQFISFRAQYATDKVLIQHTAGFGRNASPTNRESSIAEFHPSITSGSRTYTMESNQSIYPSINGFYWFMLPKQQSLTLSWNLSVTGTRRNSVYRLEGLNPIENNNKERAVAPNINMSYQKQFQRNNSLRISLMSYNTRYRTRYSGSYNDLQRLLSSENMLFIEYMQSYCNKLHLYSRAGASYVIGRVNGHTNLKQWNPRLGIQLQYQPSQKWSLSWEGWWGNSHPEASSSNTAMIQSSELLWKQGNPDLRNTIFANTSIQCSYIPVNWFSVAGALEYEGNYNKQSIEYSVIPGYDGLVSKTVNSGDFHSYSANLSATVKLFENKLVLGTNASARRVVLTGIDAQHKNLLNVSAQASYYTGRFSLTLYGGSPYKNLNAWSQGAYMKGLYTYGITAGYGTKDLKLSLNFYNWFRDKAYQTTTFHSPLYSYVERFRNDNWLGREINLSVSYTFGYGKKLQRNNELERTSSSSSAILK